MNRSLIALSILLLTVGVTFASQPTKPPNQVSAPSGPTDLQGSSTPADPNASGGRECTVLKDPESIAKAAGGTLETKSTVTDYPDCPSIQSCGGFNVTCRGQNCSDTDTGETACKLPSNQVVSCGPNKTIHAIACGCVEIAEAPCCSAHPACLCARCNASNASFACE